MTPASEPPPPIAADGVRMADVLGGFSLASDLAVGLQPEHGARSCYIGMKLAETLRFTDEERAALFYSELLKDGPTNATAVQMLKSNLKGIPICMSGDTGRCSTVLCPTLIYSTLFYSDLLKNVPRPR